MANTAGTLEGLAVNPVFWKGRRVFITGHTGFKGSWLALWLQSMGAHVYGYSLAAATSPAMFEVADVGQGMERHTVADIRDMETLRTAMRQAAPHIVFHMAAQSLVRASYADPVATYAVNVMGTVHCLEAARSVPGIQAVVCVTTDKCYENREWLWAYREDEALGGADPYSSSKAGSELVAAAYRQSFLATAGVGVATARAGNVIGGGDWAQDRLVPDFLHALDNGQTLKIRSPFAIRPWQHVLEPLAGYMRLAECLAVQGADFAESWNFGPSDSGAQTVEWIVKQLAEIRADVLFEIDATQQPKESTYLKLDSSKARARLSWTPRWELRSALERTVRWHDQWREGADMRAATLEQIDAYQTTIAA